MPERPTPADPHGLRAAIQNSAYTQEQVIARTYGNPRKPDGLAKSTLTNAIRGERAWPTDETILILGEAMDAKPGDWIQYDLARAREKLNPRFVGLNEARKNYTLVRGALGLPAPPEAIEAMAELEGATAAAQPPAKPSRGPARKQGAPGASDAAAPKPRRKPSR